MIQAPDNTPDMAADHLEIDSLFASASHIPASGLHRERETPWLIFGACATCRMGS